MRSKNITAILALILGVLGIHRFYLGQFLRGMLYLIYPIVTLTTIFEITGFLNVVREQATLSGSTDLFQFLLLFLIIPVFDCIWFFAMGQEKFNRKYNQQSLQLPKTLLFSIIVLLAAGAFNYLAYQQFYVQAKVDVSGADADVEMDAATFAREFSTDQQAAAEQYQDQILQLTSKVEADETELSEGGDKRVLILSGDGNLTIRCEFNDSEQDKVQAVEIGETITVKGSFREVMVFDVVLEDCYLVES